ncbi:MFS transporter [Catellatospora citrea]|uniref:MFS transporter n=1 Tax=Catellatospora citrea TaxID=53366 RepID=A0A8J3NZT8_9ACTN|nr:MFS transporter [Catellatospora citrea]RKE06687.1 putative MFS family arabinose efflux permease [Catellatospora citrea]GIF98683.1 MFS transporter [Catellatospora citrea]
MAVPAVDEQVREIAAYPGRPSVRVSRGRAAPFGWWPAVCIALVALIDRIEYNLLAGALPAIQREFGFDDGAAGAIATAGAIAAVLLLLPAGRLADTGRRTWTVAAVVAVWALLTLGTGLAGSYAMLFGVRVLLGAAGQLYNPPASSLLGDLYPGPSRARAYGLERAAYFAGLPIGVIVGGALAKAYDWRTGFFLVAVPGAVIAVLMLTVREPVRGVGDRLSSWYADPTAEPPTGPPAVTAPATGSGGLPALSGLVAQVRELWGIRTLRSVVSGLSILFFGLGGLFFWMPSFYQREFGLDEAASAAVGGGAGLVGILAGIGLGSWFGDRGHGRRPGWRVRLGGWSLLFGTVALAGAVAVGPFVPQVVCFGLANVGFAGAIANLTAANADVVAASRRGLGFAVLQSVITLGGALGPWLIGEASDATGSLRLAYAVVIAPLVVGSLIVLRAWRGYDADAAAALSSRDAPS